MSSWNINQPATALSVRQTVSQNPREFFPQIGGLFSSFSMSLRIRGRAAAGSSVCWPVEASIVPSEGVCEPAVKLSRYAGARLRCVSQFDPAVALDGTQRSAPVPRAKPAGTTAASCACRWPSCTWCRCGSEPVKNLPEERGAAKLGGLGRAVRRWTEAVEVSCRSASADSPLQSPVQHP